MTHSPLYRPPSAQSGAAQAARSRHPRRLPGVQPQVFADGALDEKTKQLIAAAVAPRHPMPYCIQGHTKAALRKGAAEQAPAYRGA